MLNYNSVIKNEINQENISVKEITPVMKINLRGKKREFLTNVGKNLNMILPTEANTSTTSDKLTAIWLSPDEWMIYSNTTLDTDKNEYETENLLNKNISKKNLGAVTDVTDQFVLINIKGDKIFDLFETGSPFNFNQFRNKKG